jgi:hypothetical protein
MPSSTDHCPRCDQYAAEIADLRERIQIASHALESEPSADELAVGTNSS